jgi:DNA-binding NarL/FixJ family response regulator
LGTTADASGVPLQIKVLVAEDFDPFRALIVSMINSVSNLQVIGEVADGLLAFEKARELRPDLVLMDIGLPGLNGIESARRIRELLPESRIVFVSQETAWDIVKEALSYGCGYVLKSRAASDLIAAVEAALENDRYVSEGLEP